MVKIPSPSSSSPEPPSAPSLEQVQQAFSDWRASGGSHRTPLELQRQAASLLDGHTSGSICKALSLDHRRLKRWREELMSSDKSSPESCSEFVEVPEMTSPAPPTPPAMFSASGLSLTMTHQCSDGSTVSISGHLEAPGWRWALSLLREPKR